MSARYSLYQPGSTWLHRLDARPKLLAVACVAVLLLLWRNVWLMLASLVLVQFALRSAGISRERLARVWRMTAPTLALVVVLWVLVYQRPGTPLFAFWVVRITVESLAEGLAVGLRIAALAFWAFVWLFTTDQSTLVRSLVALGLPYEWGLVIALALRYLPSTAGTLSMIADAHQARALELGHGSPLRRARAYIPIAVSALIVALRGAESTASALSARGFGARSRRTEYRRLQLRDIDWLCLGATALVTALLLWARFGLGFGAHPVRILGR